MEQVEKLKESISFNQDNLKALAIMDSSEISYDFETKSEAADAKQPLVDRLDYNIKYSKFKLKKTVFI